MTVWPPQMNTELGTKLSGRALTEHAQPQYRHPAQAMYEYVSNVQLLFSLEISTLSVRN